MEHGKTRKIDDFLVYQKAMELFHGFIEEDLHI